MFRPILFVIFVLILPEPFLKPSDPGLQHHVGELQVKGGHIIQDAVSRAVQQPGMAPPLPPGHRWNTCSSPSQGIINVNSCAAIHRPSL